MTRNNLGHHLAWLLNRGPSLYPSLQLPLRIDEDSTTAARIVPKQSTPALEQPISAATHTPAAQVQSPSGTGLEDIVKDGDRLTAETDMARLQFAPPSATKPRMLSCVSNPSSSSPRTPTVCPTEKPSSGGLYIQNQTFAKDRVHSPDRLSPQRSTQKRLPHRSPLPFDFKSPVIDVDAIDLTGDFDGATSSSGTVEAFGEPRPVWGEDFAARKEPVEKRGKKRKSDEYKSDLLSPKKTNPRIHSPISATRIRSTDEFGTIEARASRSPRKETNERATHRSPKKTDGTGDPSEVRLRGSKRVIEDSDEEEWCEELAQEDGVVPGLLSDEELYPDLSEHNSGRNRSVASAGPNTGKWEDIPKGENGGPSFASPFRHHSPTKTHGSSQQMSYPNVFPSPDTPSTQENRDGNVLEFLNLSSQFLDQLIVKLEAGVEANAQIVYHRAIQGESVDDLISQNKILVTRVSAIKQLQTEKATHQACISQREKLKEVMIQAIKQGGDLSKQSAEVAKSRAIAKELKEIETKMSELLRKADVFASFDGHSAPVETPEQDVLVEATQPARHTEPAYGQINSANRSPGPRAQSALPTTSALPVSAVRNGFSHVVQNGDNYPSDFAPIGRTLPISPVLAPAKSITRSIMETSSHTGYASCSVPERRQVESADDDEFMVDDDIFTRNMGTPVRAGGGMDEFGLDTDDEEMLEAAENIEGGFSSAEEEYTFQNRKVFAETSGNATRVPLAKKPAPSLASMMCHPWSKDVKVVMKDRFHLRGFRPNQLEAINATLSGKDAFVLMPTGGGKSLCYQLPSVIGSGRTRGVTVVISPLLSLMEDQVSHLRKLDIEAFFINGEVEADHKRWLLQTLASPGAEKHIQLLYITPEMINKNMRLVDCLGTLHRRQKLARIVIDEAHCVSQWGHDFRPDYKELGEVRSQFPGVPVMALTATATENVKVDVIHNLGMRGCEIFTQSFNRPNLTYEVRRKKGAKDLLTSMADTITTSYKGQSGIIYCLSRKDCEKVAEALRKQHRIKAEHYHAGMDSDKRANVQQLWQSGRCKVIVATIAFGMGIDKPDVRFVVHHSMPKSLEGYYQETGRAGRDGKRSGCYLYYGYKDASTLKRMIDQGEGSREQKDRQRQMLRNVIQFCENRSDCRRVQVLAYFNESFRKEDCNASCDNCKSDSVFEIHDFTQYAASAVRLVRSLNKERITLLQCVDIFRGLNTQKVKNQHKSLPEFGAGSDLDLGEAERLFFRLLSEEAFKEENYAIKKGITIQYIQLGSKAAQFENGRRELKLHVRVSPDGKSKRKNHGTGVRAAVEDYPQSTNVSSPIVSASRRRLARNRIPGTQGRNLSDEDDDSDGFEQIRIAGKLGRQEKHVVGPPITDDEKMNRLDSLHHMVVEDFVIRAKEECHDIMMKKSLRSQPFSDSILRDMAIRFPTGKSQLLSIPGIDPDKVDRYGAQFLRLIQSAQRHYEDLRKEQDMEASGVIHDPNHDNVINISSGDEFSDDDLFADGASSLDLDGNVTSQYFEVPQTRVSGNPSNRRPASRASPAPSTSSKGRQRRTTKRTGRKKPADSAPKRKSSGPRWKTTNSNKSASSSVRKGGSSKTPRSRIEMMPA